MRALAILSVITGVGLAIAETLLNWGDWQSAPFFIVDFVGAALLVAGGASVLQRYSVGVALMSGGWYFCAGMVWMSFFGNLALGCPDQSLTCGPYLALVGGFFAYTVVGSAAVTLVACRGVRPNSD
ncbi:MAG: hypothetical protein AAGH76_14175 [Pseudomonadota bacterium]